MTKPPKRKTATDEDLDLLAELVEVPLATFDKVFQRAQHARDAMDDVAVASPGAKDDRGHIRDCFDFARANAFLGQLLAAALEENVAGPPGTAGARAFASLARKLAGIKVATVFIPEERAQFVAEARNPEGFDADPMRLQAQINTAMRSVCKITVPESGRVGTGVLIAPHLVATAAHVVRELVDEAGKARPGSAAKITVQMDAVAYLPGAATQPIAVAEDWLVDCSLWPAAMLPDNAGVAGMLPNEADLVDHDDLIVIRLEEAPGFLRGWLELAEPEQQFDEKRKGLMFHHHPMGGDQKVSFGRYCGPYGPRFKHDCSSLGGSSGGPVINVAARIAGVHHGTIQNGANNVNLGGGGLRLVQWRIGRKEEFDAPRALNPVWEIRKTGAVGSGQPVVGFEPLQRQVWNMELAEKTAALFVKGGNLAGRLVFDVIEAMLAADRALVIRFDRVFLNDIIQALSAQAATESQTRVAIDEIAARIGKSGGAVTDRHSTDPVEARAAASTIADALQSLPGDRRIWTLVNIGDLKVPTPLSEALAFLYQAVLRLDGDRGRLVIAGADDAVHAKVVSLVQDVFEDDIPAHALKEPDASDLARYFRRWAREVGYQAGQMADVAEMMAGVCLGVANEKVAADRSDFYAQLEGAIRFFKQARV